MTNLNGTHQPKADRKSYLVWVVVLLSTVLLSVTGGKMITALYLESLGMAAIVALLASRNNNLSLRVRQFCHNFLIAFLLLAGAYILVLIFDILTRLNW
jgi:hypothetical protein